MVLDMRTHTPLVVKIKSCRLLYWARVIVSRPVELSEVAPAAFLYLLKPSVAIRIKVVPVGTLSISCQRQISKRGLTSVNNTGRR